MSVPASSAQHEISLILESTYGTTPPTTPAFSKKLITGTTLALTKGKIESATIRPDRQVADVRAGNRQVGGDISVELNYGGFDDLLEAVFGGTWTDDVLVPGVTRRSFSILRNFTDLSGGSNPFQLYKGVELNTLAITIAPETFVKAVFGVMGREVAYAGAVPSGATFNEASTNKAFDSFTGTIEVDGAPVACVTELSINLENGMEPRFVVFEDKTNQPKIGKTRVTGSLTLYFENSDFLIAFNGAVNRSLLFTLTDLGGNEYAFSLPSIHLDGGQTDVDGEGDITITVPFSCIYQDGEENPDVISITRTDD